MGHSVFLARLIGPVMLAVGAGAFVNGKAYRAMAEEALQSRALIYLSGLLLMTAGLALVLTHNVWIANWPVLITLMGWLAVVSGLLRILMPQGTERIGRRMLRHNYGLPAAGAVWLVLGLVLTIAGYAR